MTEGTADFVLIGAGQNNLTAAAYLAAAGHQVTLLERLSYWGGGCSTAEVTVPGFRHDLHATNVYMVQANPLLKNDELGLFSRFGLEFADTREAVSHGTIFPDGEVIPLYKDVERSIDHIGRFSAADARAYRTFMDKALRYMRLVSFALFSPPASGGAFRSILDQSAEGRDLLALMTSSSADLVNSLFTDERVKVHMLRLASEMMMRADAPGGGFGLMMMAGLYHEYPVGFVTGGSQGFSDALVRCIRHHGGEIVLDAEVRAVEVAHGKATAAITTDGRRYAAREAIVAGLPPWDLQKYVPGTEAVAARVRPVPTSDYTCFLTHVALNEAPEPAIDADLGPMCFNVLAPPDFQAMVQTTRDVGEGRAGSAFTASYVCATQFDPSRAPPGKHTLYLYQPAPTLLAGRPLSAWDDVKADHGRNLLEKAGGFVPNLAGAVLGVTHETPHDIAINSPSYRNGDVAGLAMTPDQFLSGRPTPELAQYRVPGIDNLYLCGPFMHPGGGANGGGRPVAMRIMMDRGMQLSGFSY